MEDRKPPSWEDIRGLINQVDDMCRESEHLRAHAERILKRPAIWPDRRREPKKAPEPERFRRQQEDASTHEGNEGSL